MSERFTQVPVDVTTAAGAAQAKALLEKAPELAVDVEADAMHAFRGRLCFVQLGTDAHIFLFDTLVPDVRIDILKEKFEDERITKYFHAAGGDLQFLAEANVRVRGLFDTHRAVTLLGSAKVGLADLVRERLGVELKKEHQQSDFSIRPIPGPMREYIADDVRYLCEIGRQVRAECEKADILEEVLLDCERMAEDALARPDVGADFKPKIPKDKLKPPEQKLALAITLALHKLRLQWAEAANVPMGRMLSNAALSEIAVRPPVDIKALSKVPNVRGPFVREHGEEVLSVVRGLLEQHRAGTLPDPEGGARTPKDPKRKKREEALKLWRGQKAIERKVTPSVVLSNALVDDLIDAVPTTLEELSKLRWLGEKRLRLYGPQLLEVLKSV